MEGIQEYGGSSDEKEDEGEDEVKAIITSYFFYSKQTNKEIEIRIRQVCFFLLSECHRYPTSVDYGL